MRRPDKRISPLAMRPGGSINPMIAAPVSDLPAPDSPTTPSTSPGAMVKLTSRTAASVPRRVGNSTRSAQTSNSGATAVERRLATTSACDATTGNWLDLVDDGRPFRPHRILELRVDVITLARLDVEPHLLQRAGKAAVARRLDCDRVHARRNFIGHGEHRIAADGHDARGPAVGDRAVVACAGDFTPRRSPGLATGGEDPEQHHSGHAFFHRRSFGSHHRNFGFSASRSQSPSRLIASTMITSAAPGKIVIHHSPENKKSLPTRISVPSDGRVGGTPTPRNDSVASVMIAVAMLIVASTNTGPSTFGSRCRRMMPSGEIPITRAACTYSLFFSTIVDPRTVRAYCTQFDKPIAAINTASATSSCAPRGSTTCATPSIKSAIRIAGNESCTSATRMISASMRPPA